MAINMENCGNNPITNEELAGLIIGSQGMSRQLNEMLREQIDNYFTNKAKEDGAAQAALISNQAKGLQEIKDMLSERDKEISELKTLVHQSFRPTVTISYSVANASQWKKETSNTIDILCPKLKLTRSQVYGRVYDLIKIKYGTDVRALYENDKSNKESIISMCAYDDGLRAKFDSSLKDLYDSVRYGSVEVMRMPGRVRRDCLAIAPNKPANVTFKKILKKMEEISGMDIDAYIERNASQVGYASFAKSYFVSKSKILYPIYNQAVEELKKASSSGV